MTCDLCGEPVHFVSIDVQYDARKIARVCLICALRLERDIAEAASPAKGTEA